MPFYALNGHPVGAAESRRSRNIMATKISKLAAITLSVFALAAAGAANAQAPQQTPQSQAAQAQTAQPMQPASASAAAPAGQRFRADPDGRHGHWHHRHHGHRHHHMSPQMKAAFEKLTPEQKTQMKAAFDQIHADHAKTRADREQLKALAEKFGLPAMHGHRYHHGHRHGHEGFGRFGEHKDLNGEARGAASVQPATPASTAIAQPQK